MAKEDHAQKNLFLLMDQLSWTLLRFGALFSGGTPGGDLNRGKQELLLGLSLLW